MAADTPSAVVVDDSHFMRTVISDILEEGGVEVMDEARNGAEAVESVATHDPDVVTMDVEMPDVDGIEAVERIMDRSPTPILMLSAHTDDNADVTFEALDRGAVDFFTKPGGEISTEISGFEDQLVRKVRSVAASDVRDVERDTGSVGTVGRDARYVDDPALVVGASTGGPSVVERLLSELPLEADLRVIVVQHMPDDFTDRFADRVDRHSDYAVREASDGDRIGGGEAVVAPGGHHLVVKASRNGRTRLELTDDAPEHGVRPAIDVTMGSAAEQVDDPLVGVVLTGMGDDGAAGLEAIQRAGGYTVAQDETTSTVFGMPKRAIATGCVDAVSPIDDLTEAVLDAIREDDP